eukprot:CAMPEP_0117522248 /NCGR_PEP_ID=MMETSP0784-20121206/34108_1 /TAXON_ID=39447 /ORGANISM="" /LENGTH=187 /DNA_ID=CAMNT_0005318311 /DNA_START=93 /DNA_END=653 /DNA_ORIENTATION=+
MIRFILMVNKQGQTRLAQYYEYLTVNERVTLEGELIRKCLSRVESQCSFVEYRGFRVVYRRYASLYFIVGADNDDSVNELALLEFIHTLVETLDKYFENVCELDIMFNLDKAHIILDEIVLDGCIVETNKAAALNSLYLIEKTRDEPCRAAATKAGGQMPSAAILLKVSNSLDRKKMNAGTNARLHV